ncbi:hypothetical protein TVAG_191170 [Trichomonas vaginalis G3]|uniref:Uncharacterized protein n=1 Tax=Trichomonas vaginalis (strain ATCC PRA-98 / G3) TaxID=412133 RepID=A2EFK0_TRIV3|nr:armadillo (ARM) repeat-containing protein family [Trichomonas vaginalis G3]EAY08594.1 hypothetical protein TVAG_191170 [Trichomonas vaginalis G3]KAI5497895.1 armadillo (ARM) repeat-containing protein family [Trichomonas vaginalis G3]|eukprot:XP_001320817.1 hypothetical protein [Trichomonas vaginalis G3]
MSSNNDIFNQLMNKNNQKLLLISDRQSKNDPATDNIRQYLSEIGNKIQENNFLSIFSLLEQHHDFSEQDILLVGYYVNENEIINKIFGLLLNNDSTIELQTSILEFFADTCFYHKSTAHTLINLGIYDFWKQFYPACPQNLHLHYMLLRGICANSFRSTENVFEEEILNKIIPPDESLLIEWIQLLHAVTEHNISYWDAVKVINLVFGFLESDNEAIAVEASKVLLSVYVRCQTTLIEIYNLEKRNYINNLIITTNSRDLFDNLFWLVSLIFQNSYGIYYIINEKTNFFDSLKQQIIKLQPKIFFRSFSNIMVWASQMGSNFINYTFFDYTLQNLDELPYQEQREFIVSSMMCSLAEIPGTLEFIAKQEKLGNAFVEFLENEGDEYIKENYLGFFQQIKEKLIAKNFDTHGTIFENPTVSEFLESI